MNSKTYFTDLILEGHSVDFGLVSISAQKIGNGVEYQVYCGHSAGFDKEGHKFSKLYNSVDDAVSKFFELKETCYGKTDTN